MNIKGCLSHLHDGEHLTRPAGAAVVGDDEDAERDALEHADVLRLALVAEVERRQRLLHLDQLHDVREVVAWPAEAAQQLVEEPRLNLGKTVLS